MDIKKESRILVENRFFYSVFLDREVVIDYYHPPSDIATNEISLLLINDGQDLVKFKLEQILEELYSNQKINPVFCVGIYCSVDRRMEYGTVSMPDYKGRGAKATLYEKFIIEELLPFVKTNFLEYKFIEKAFAGFSLGGLSAIDIVWRHPSIFSIAGVFSGSLWWRLKGLQDGYNEDTDRIMHKIIRDGEYKPGLKFYFTTGSLDEKMDRNNNGIIDSIDDTLGLIDELIKKGYNKDSDITYINYDSGRHDVFTWGKAMPAFLKWGWGREE